MCLSTAYRDSNPDEVLMQDVSAINIEGENVILTDLFGEKKTFKGRLTFADLTGAVIKIDC